MSLPSDRDMPVVEARYHEMAHAWRVTLPGKLELSALGTAEVEELVARHAPGSAIRYVRGRVAPESEAEQRLAHGDR